MSDTPSRAEARPGVVLALLAAGLVVVASATHPGAGIQAAQAEDPARTIVVLSDLHMGEGRDRSGEWSPYEDFRWGSEFSVFLSAVGREGNNAVDLILNGDVFELLQSSDIACVGEESATGPGCTEGEAVKRLERILRSHPGEIGALAAFAGAGSNRVVFVPGDHDAALFFPLLGRRLVNALGSPAGRVQIASSGYWLSPDGRVYAEHGHQIGVSPHRFAQWPPPVGRQRNGPQLERPWGEAVIQPLHNRFERRYPIVDNMTVLGSGIKFAVGAERADPDVAAAPLLRYLLHAISWQQFRMELDDGDVRPPTWDVGQVRGQGPSFLVSTLPDDDPYKPAARRASEGGHLAGALESLTDAEIVSLCDYRAAVRRARRRFEPLVTQFPPRGPVVVECPRMPETRGALFDYFWRSRDEMLLAHLDAVAGRLPGRRAPTVFVQGHTHLPDRSQTTANLISGGLLKIPMEGFSPLRGALTPVVINDGAWQRTLTPVQLARMAAERGIADTDRFGTLRPEDLPPCYSFVRIGRADGVPAPAVRYWRQSPANEWEFAQTCGR